MSDWDGKERRISSEDHDLLTRIDVKLTNFIATLEEVRKKVNWHDKVIYIGLGGLAVLEFILKMNSK